MIQFICFKFGDLQLFDTVTFFETRLSTNSFRKAYKTPKIKSFFPTNVLANPTKWKTQIFPLLMSTIKVVAVILFTQNTMIMLIYSKRQWPHNKPSPYWNYGSLPLLALRAVKIKKIEGKQSWFCSTTSSAGTEFSEARQKTNAFYQNKNIDMLGPGCILAHLPTSVYSYQQDPCSMLSRMEMKNFWRKFQEMVLMTLFTSSFFLLKHFFESHQTFANLLLALM